MNIVIIKHSYLHNELFLVSSPPLVSTNITLPAVQSILDSLSIAHYLTTENQVPPPSHKANQHCTAQQINVVFNAQNKTASE